MNFHEEHLSLMLSHRISVKKLTLLSATKQKLSLELLNAGMMRLSEDNFLFVTETGDKVLDATITDFNKHVHMMP